MRHGGLRTASGAAIDDQRRLRRGSQHGRRRWRPAGGRQVHQRHRRMGTSGADERQRRIEGGRGDGNRIERRIHAGVHSGGETIAGLGWWRTRGRSADGTERGEVSAVHGSMESVQR